MPVVGRLDVTIRICAIRRRHGIGASSNEACRTWLGATNMHGL